MLLLRLCDARLSWLLLGRACSSADELDDERADDDDAEELLDTLRVTPLMDTPSPELVLRFFTICCRRGVEGEPLRRR